MFLAWCAWCTLISFFWFDFCILSSTSKSSFFSLLYLSVTSFNILTLLYQFLTSFYDSLFNQNISLNFFFDSLKAFITTIFDSWNWILRNEIKKSYCCCSTRVLEDFNCIRRTDSLGIHLVCYVSWPIIKYFTLRRYSIKPFPIMVIAFDCVAMSNSCSPINVNSPWPFPWFTFSINLCHDFIAEITLKKVKIYAV